MADNGTTRLTELLAASRTPRKFTPEHFAAAMLLGAVLQVVGCFGRVAERGAPLPGRVRGCAECFDVRTDTPSSWREKAEEVDSQGVQRVEALAKRLYTDKERHIRQRCFGPTAWLGILVYVHGRKVDPVAPEDVAKDTNTLGDAPLVFELGTLLGRLLTNAQAPMALDPTKRDKLPRLPKTIPPFEGSEHDFPDLVEDPPRTPGVEDLLKKMLDPDAINRAHFGLLGIVSHPWLSSRAQYAGFADGPAMAAAVAARLGGTAGDDWCPAIELWRGRRHETAEQEELPPAKIAALLVRAKQRPHPVPAASAEAASATPRRWECPHFAAQEAVTAAARPFLVRQAHGQTAASGLEVAELAVPSRRAEAEPFSLGADPEDVPSGFPLGADGPGDAAESRAPSSVAGDDGPVSDSDSDGSQVMLWDLRCRGDNATGGCRLRATGRFVPVPSRQEPTFPGAAAYRQLARAPKRNRSDESDSGRDLDPAAGAGAGADAGEGAEAGSRAASDGAAAGSPTGSKRMRGHDYP